MNGMPSPQAVLALVDQLITAAGVVGEDISIYEAANGRTIGSPLYAKIRAEKNPEFQAVRFVTNTDFGLGGRQALKPDTANPIRFSNPDAPTAYLPQSVTESMATGSCEANKLADQSSPNEVKRIMFASLCSAEYRPSIRYRSVLPPRCRWPMRSTRGL